MQRPRFLADAMVAELARWLRILGEDALWAPPEWTDARVLREAHRDERVIVTRDDRLVERARREGLQGVRVPQGPVEDALTVVYQETGLRPERDRLATRCSMCNGPLEHVDGPEAKARAEAAGKEPPLTEVLERHQRFWSCTVCGQAYWRGTHWDTIEQVRGNVIERLGSDPSP